MLKVAKTEKSSSDVESECARIGASSMQGWRWYMEDAHCVVADLDGKGLCFAGVYDAHISPKAALFCAEKMHSQILDRLERDGDEELAAILHKSFLQIDEDFRSTINPNPDSLCRAGGCTASVVLLGKNKVTVANVGDCRCVMSVRGGIAEDLTKDHKPELPQERERIEAAGGKVLFGRLKDLNISRGIGDFRLKVPDNFPPERQQLTPAPEIKQVEFVEDGELEFVVVASDGIWECRTSQQVVDFVRSRLSQDHKLSKICEELLDSCVKVKNPKDKDEPGTSDNITVVIMQPIKQL